MSIFKTIQNACDDLNSHDIYLMEIRIPYSLRDEFQKELHPVNQEGIEIDDAGKVSITKMSIGNNIIKIKWYEGK